jgi:hypothetical protein
MGKAIIDSLSESSKEQLIAGALEFLLAKPEIQDRYSSTKKYGDSPIEVAMKDTVRVLAREVAEEVVQEIRPKLTEEVRALVSKIDALEDDATLRYQLMDALLSAANVKIKDGRGY